MEERDLADDSLVKSFISPAVIAVMRNFHTSSGDIKTDEEIIGNADLIADKTYDDKQRAIDSDFQARENKYLDENEARLLASLILSMEAVVFS
jgi:hypothetical protein